VVAHEDSLHVDKTARELTTTVVEDLKYFRDGWTPTVADDTLRRTSASLRRLLIYGDYGNAWRAASLAKQPSVEAVDLTARILGLGFNPTDIDFAQAGGGTSSDAGITVSGAVVGHNLREDPRLRASAGPVRRSFTLSEFRPSPELIVDGMAIARDAVVKFVCNKLGGAHFDPDRPGEWELLDHLNDGRLHVAGRRCVYYSILSIGQVLGSSPQTVDFLRHAESQFGIA
jgi:hypothetical protein